MKLYDQHLHSKYSFDSESEPEENVLRAIEVGLSGLTFTEHYDTHPSERDSCVFDDAGINDSIASLQDRYGDRIRIGKGIEVCYQPAQMDTIRGFLDTHHFDVVLLSVHWCDGKPVHIQDRWIGADPDRMTRVYLETVLEAVEMCARLADRGERPFDILGHLDFIKRYTNRYFRHYDLEPHRGLIDEILKGCLAAGLIPEVNTATLRRSLPDPMPDAHAIRRYAELGGKHMSMGSDAHRADETGAGLDAAAKLMQAAKIESIAIFENRRLQLLPLDD